jgi:hypothetical protein
LNFLGLGVSVTFNLKQSTDKLRQSSKVDGDIARTGGPHGGAGVMNISQPFIERPVATSLLMAAVGFVGLVAFPFLPVAPLPQVDFPTIQVNATLQGASAETMAA